MVAEAEAPQPDIAPTPAIMPVVHTLEVDSVVQVRNLAARELDVRLMPWDQIIETVDGPETVARGAFAGTDATAVMLMGLEHEMHLGVGQDGRPVPTRHPVGRGVSIDDREDAAYMTFRVAKTARGDEVLALAADGIVSGVSAEFMELPGGTEVSTRAGRRTRVHKLVHLMGASTTYRPAYQGASVLAVRSEQGVNEMPEATEQAVTPTAPAPFDVEALGASIGQNFSKSLDAAIEAIEARAAAHAEKPQIPEELMEKYLGRLEALEENARASFSLPSGDAPSHPEDFGRGDWMHLVLRTLTGETVSQNELKARTAADLITTDNLGVVPPTYRNEIIGIIDKSRPFMETTRRLTTPKSGVSMVVPVITTRPTTGIQSTEKTELASTTTSITSTSFGMTSIGGYGDISIQLLKRSDPSYLEMYVDLLAEQYAIDADDKAVDVLIAAGMSQGGAFDPDDGPKFGVAWANASAVSRLLVPDTLWMSTEAVKQFIDATDAVTNGPLYGNLAGSFAAGNGPAGSISGLRPVHVPALDDEDVDMIVGPSRGFGWAEDGTYTLEVDVPAKAGRDVGIVGMTWFAPLYPEAFTRFWLES